ncbi:MAG: serine hydrolase [Marinilabiliaceae bacterium]|nr:serine hydrolase [Marinilabiliaceae bacterium]
MKRLSTLLLLLIYISICFGQIPSSEAYQLRFYASIGYEPIANMGSIDVGLIDQWRYTDDDGEEENSQTEGRQAIDFMRRYYDNIYIAHPSVLRNWNPPSHLVVVANSIKGISDVVGEIIKYRSIESKHTRIILLTTSRIRMENHKAVEELFQQFDALYETDAIGREACDLLTQAFWGGREISECSDNNLWNSNRLFPRTQKKTRLAYLTQTGEEIRAIESKIDEIAQEAISAGATPGISIIVARKGVVIIDKQYGYTTYEKETAVDSRTLYDIASLSKIVGTLPHVIRLFDRGELNAQQRLSDVLGLKGWQGEIRVGQLLLHTSGLPAGVPVFALAIDSATFTPPLYSRQRKKGFQKKIGSNLYINDEVRLREGLFNDIRDDVFHLPVTSKLWASDTLRNRIWRHIAALSPMNKSYRYSDINFLYLQRIIEKKRNKTIDELFESEIAKPLGLRRILYKPSRSYRISEISPTANDTYYRREQIWSTPHDEVAAAMGGVAGNAGLFATANELVKIGQMFLNGGSYGGVKLFESSTFDQFITRHDTHCRRGYGFDMPERQNNKKSPVPDKLPKTSFGHTGFTGTMMWIDPESETIFVFLSNRIYTSVDNSKITKLNIRSRILEELF